MRLAWLALLGLPLAASCQDADRFGVGRAAKGYPQASAKEALSSVLKAIDAKQFDYLVAQLADPSFMDDRVKRVYAGRFDEQVRDTRTRLDPSAVKQLRKFAADGRWTLDKDSAVLALEDVKERVVRL